MTNFVEAFWSAKKMSGKKKETKKKKQNMIFFLRKITHVREWGYISINIYYWNVPEHEFYNSKV